MTVLDLDEVAPAPPHPRRRGWLVALTGLLTIALVIAGTAMWQRRQVEEPLLTPDWEAPPSEVVWTMSPTASATDDDMFTYLMPVSPDHALVFYSGLTAWAALPTDTALALLDLRTGQRLWERALDGRQSYPLAARPGEYIVEIVVSTSPSGSAAVRTTDWTTGAELSRLDDVDPASFQGFGGRILPPDVDTLALSHDDRVGLHRVLELDDPVWEADDASRVLAVTDDIVVTARAAYDRATGSVQEWDSLPAGQSWVQGVGDGLVESRTDGAVVRWETSHGRALCTRTGASLLFATDGVVAVSTETGRWPESQLLLLDPTTGAPLPGSEPIHLPADACAQALPHTDLFMTTAPDGVSLHSLTTGRVLTTIASPGSTDGWLGLSGQGRETLYLDIQGDLGAYDIATGRELWRTTDAATYTIIGSHLLEVSTTGDGRLTALR